MKILEQTHTKLAMKHLPTNNWWTGGLLISCSLLFFIGLLFLMPISASFSCQRIPNGQINCNLKKFYILKDPQQQKVFDPQEAIIRAKRGSKGQISYQIFILSPFGEYDFLPAQSKSAENEQIVAEINNFISSRQTYLRVSKHQWHEYSIYLAFISIFMICGIFLLSSPVVKCVFYKSLNKVFIEYQSLWGKKVQEYPLINISRIDSQVKNTRHGKLYRPVLVLRSQETIPIHKDYTNEKNNSYIIDNINSFISS